MIIDSHTSFGIEYVQACSIEPGDLLREFGMEFSLVISVRSGEYQGNKRIFVSCLRYGAITEHVFALTSCVHIRRAKWS
jgi:hypothetical protein